MNKEVQLREQLSKYLYNANQTGKEVALTTIQFYELFEGSCHYCGQESSPKVNGIDRLDSLVGYVPSNVVSCCVTCNFMKQSLTEHEFLAHVERISLHQSKLKSDFKSFRI